MSVEKKYILVLSARDKTSLYRQVRSLYDFLKKNNFGDNKLTDICYTLQVGRDVLENRVAFLVNSMDELLNSLDSFCTNASVMNNVYVGNGEVLGFADSIDFSSNDTIAKNWANAGNVDWKEFYRKKGIKPRIISLPSYSFEKNKYWDSNFAINYNTANKKNLVDTLFYEESWKPCDDIKYSQESNKGTVICFLPDEGFEEIKDYLNNLSETGFEYVFVKRGYSFQTIEENCYTVKADYFEFEYLFRVIQDTYSNICGIMYLWSLDVYTSDEEVFFGNVTEMIKGVAKSALRVPKMLIAGGYKTWQERCLSESLVSLEKAVPMIIPEMNIRVVCISTLENNIQKCVKIFLDELKTDKKESVLYENDVRKHLVLEEIKEIKQDRILLENNGVYCITGGMGGIGKVITSWLLKDYQATVILLGRRKKENVVSQLKEFDKYDGKVEYIQADVCNYEELQNALNYITRNYGTINGFFHAAGLEGKKSLIDASRKEFLDVLSPKLKGTKNLIQATSGLSYKFMFLCSSSSAMLGDFGNCAYSLGNRFLMLTSRFYDERIKVINWPLWKDGGMGQDDTEMQKMYLTSSGQVALENKDAVQILSRFLNSTFKQILVIVGKRERIESFLFRKGEEKQKKSKRKKVNSKKKAITKGRRRPFMNDWSVEDCIIYELKEATNKILHIDIDDMGENENLADFGYDSITLVEFASDVSERFSERITPEVFFSYPTLGRLGHNIYEKFSDKLENMYRHSSETEETEEFEEFEDDDDDVNYSEKENIEHSSVLKNEKIAIVGISGRFPSADNVDELWQIVRDGKEVIKEIPKERTEWWEGKNHLDYDYRMGVINGIKEFDPLFFEISPSEAETIDPKQRIILEEIWKALEDAGYGEKLLESEKIGVFVGAEQGDYEGLFSKEEYVTSNNTSLIAARIAYFLNFKGPNMTINTACSSGLTAAHQAVRSIQSGDCDSAIVAGISLACTSRAYDSMEAAGMLSKDRKCRAFDRKASGMVPAEAAAVIVLKSEKKAREDGNYIYGIIAGNEINYDGKTNGITAPSGESQISLLKSVYERNKINPENVGLIMAHGTGTRLGDPIEMNALVDAFRLFTGKKEYCSVTSVKSNLGHSLAASGLVSLIVLLLAMRGKKLPPQINCDEKSEYIKWEDTPFYINDKLKDWNVNPEGNRVGSVSAFGMGGTNVHFVVESTEQLKFAQTQKPYYLIVLSAKTQKALEQKRMQLSNYLDNVDYDFSMKDLEFTLLEGRMQFKHRYAIVVKNRQEAIEMLNGNILPNRDVFKNKINKTFKPQESIKRIVQENTEMLDRMNSNELEYQRCLNTLAKYYSEGYELDGRAMYGNKNYKRISLPSYPFEKDICWVKNQKPRVVDLPRISNNGFNLENESNAMEFKYEAILNGDQFYFRDHIIGDKALFPGVGYLELVRQSVEDAFGSKERKHIDVTFRNIGWINPISCEERQMKSVYVTFDKSERQEHNFMVYAIEDNVKSVKCQGIVGISERTTKLNKDLLQIKLDAINQAKVVVESKQLYEKYRKLQMCYGKSFQYIQKMYVLDEYVLSKLEIIQEREMEAYNMIPGIIDGALQSIVGFTFVEGSEYSEIKVPFGIDKVVVHHPCSGHMWAIAHKGNSVGKIEKYDVELFDENGVLCVEIQGYVSIALQKDTEEKGILLRKEQVEVEYLADEQSKNDHVDLCIGINNVPEGALEPVKARGNSTIDEWFQTALLAIVEKTKEMIHSKYEKERNLQVVIPNEGEDLLLRAIGALFQTATKENPLFRGKVIEMSKTESKETVKKLLEAESNNMDNVHVIYKQGKRFVERMEQVESLQNGNKPWKDKGVYFVTGGNGGLGRIFAREIANSVKEPVIILVGRRELDENGKSFISELKEMNSIVEYITMDITNKESVTDNIQKIVTRYGKINGILHCAGVNYDNYLIKKKEEEICKTLAPKATGVVLLDNATKNLDLDFFICFSSISGAIGSAGQADYASANAFMDEYCIYRNKLVEKGSRKGVSISINWPLWKDGGMHVDEATEKTFRELYGIISMPTKQGIELFYLIWNNLHRSENIVCLYGIQSTLKREIVDNLTKISGKTLISNKKDIKLFKEEWIYQELPIAEKEQNVIVCVAQNRSFMNIVSSEIEICNKSTEIIWIIYDDSYKKISSYEYCVNYEQEEDYIQVFEEIEKDFNNVDTVLYLSPLSNKIFLQDLSGVDYILKAFQRTGLNVEKMLLAGGYENSTEKAFADSLIGIESVVKNSNLDLSINVILGDKKELDYASFIHYMLKESASQQTKNVSYENGMRKLYHNELIELENNNQVQTKIKTYGTYIIIGNVAELSFELANYLNKKYSTNLVIASREDENKIKTRLMQLQQSGATIRYIQSELSSQEQLEHLKNTANRLYGKINGVFFVSDLLRNIEEYKNSQIIVQPKIQEVIAFEKVFQNENIDFISYCLFIAKNMNNLESIYYTVKNRFISCYGKYCNPTIERKLVMIECPDLENENIHSRNITSNTAEINSNTVINVLEYVLSQSSNNYIAKFEPHNSVENSSEYKFNVNQHRDYTESIQENERRIEVSERNEIMSSNNAQEKQLNDENTKKALTILKQIVSKTLKIPENRIDEEDDMEEYGLTSIVIINLIKDLEEIFGSLPKTLFYEYSTLQELAEYIGTQYSSLFAVKNDTSPYNDNNLKSELKVDSVDVYSEAKTIKVNDVKEENYKAITNKREDVAIIGLSGSYPKSKDMNEFWTNLKEGFNGIEKVPVEKWDYEKYQSRMDEEKVFSQYGGFIEDVDKFDPLFFRISPIEAERTDPQERIFLQYAYKAIEDAGYTKKQLEKIGNVGVYVGSMYSEYQYFGVEEQMQGNMVAYTGTLSSIANRVSFFLNVHGPSMAVDTMCSSSLTAIYLACHEISRGRCDMMIAGGVNLSLHPNKYVMLAQNNMASLKGRCASFGEGGDGYVPSEGVGVVVLKSLKKAIEDGDHIYGVIKSIEANHGGKTSGYSVPNPKAQTDVIERALKSADINPETINYIETHGTGTSLGDPIEITSLTNAYRKYTDKTGICTIGSVKSNIGHCEGAAGLAALSKVLLQLKHEQLVPSIHSETLNPYIDFEKTPFNVAHQLKKWERVVLNENGTKKEYPLRAGIQSFGAGGSNVHMIVEEYKVEKAPTYKGPYGIVLSAKTEQQVKQIATKLLEWINMGVYSDEDMASIAYTLQTGREAMDYRMAFCADSLKETAEKLKAYLNEEAFSSNEIFIGKKQENNNEFIRLFSGVELTSIIKQWVEAGKLEKVIESWTMGMKVEWQELYGNKIVNKISLPTYPFAKMKCWVETNHSQFEKISSEKSELEIITVYLGIENVPKDAISLGKEQDEIQIQKNKLERILNVVLNSDNPSKCGINIILPSDKRDNYLFAEEIIIKTQKMHPKFNGKIIFVSSNSGETELEKIVDFEKNQSDFHNVMYENGTRSIMDK
ncbi:MAG: SDR family NAD(P)-dependent oxidoreductase [Acutalibacteraceae bacterium]|nr:SDR family NAD(P)-dependent oxidoreductase [Acutalibacteraceae bacterium]